MRHRDRQPWHTVEMAALLTFLGAFWYGVYRAVEYVAPLTRAWFGAP